MLEAKTVLITGAAGALGRAVAMYFAGEAHSILLLDRSEALLRETFPSLGTLPSCRFLGCDVTDTVATAAAVHGAAPAGVHVLVHIAGGFTMGSPTHAIDRGEWEHMMNLNAWSFVSATGAVVPSMVANRCGRIVAISARGAACGAAQMAAYIASKSALQRLVESLSCEVRASGIAVNSVAPSIIDTPANRAAMPDADHSRWVPTDRLAKVIGFLSSEAAADIHGRHLVVDGCC